MVQELILLMMVRAKSVEGTEKREREEGESGGERKGGERKGGERKGGERKGGERKGGERKGGERKGGKEGNRVWGLVRSVALLEAMLYFVFC